MIYGLLTVAAPLVLAAALPFTRRRLRVLATMPLVAAVLGTLAVLAATTFREVAASFAWVAPFTLEFSLDSWKLVLLAFVFVFQLMIGRHAVSSLLRSQRPALLCASLLLAFASACGVLLSDNVLVLIVFWELFLLALYGSILSGGEQAERTAQKALIIGGASDFLMLFGLMLYLRLGGNAILSDPMPIEGSRTALLAFVLVFLGAGAKAGMFPFHTWIPEAAERMPGVGFAALPASLEKLLGIGFLFTLTTRMFVLDDQARFVMYAFALATLFAVLLPALVEKNLKRVLALTAISPVGFMIAGMASGEAAGIAGALFYVLTHATYKSGLFLAADTFENTRKSAGLEQLRGVGRALPLLGLGFVLSFAAAISLPPTGGFASKELVFEGVLQQGRPVILALLALGAAINVAVFLKLLVVVLERRAEPRANVPFGERLPGLALGVLAVASPVVYAAASGALSARIGDATPHWIAEVFRLSPLSALSLAIWGAGIGLYLAARGRSVSPAGVFDGLRQAPLIGRGLALAEAKKLDAYEIGVRIVERMTRVVFQDFERLIDRAVYRLILAGERVSRRFLSAAHNGLYSNYLAWALAGLLVVLSLVLV